MKYRIHRSLLDTKYGYVHLCSRIDGFLIWSLHKIEDQQSRGTDMYAFMFQKEHDEQVDVLYARALAEEEKLKGDTKTAKDVHDITEESKRLLDNEN